MFGLHRSYGRLMPLLKMDAQHPSSTCAGPHQLIAEVQRLLHEIGGVLEQPSLQEELGGAPSAWPPSSGPSMPAGFVLPFPQKWKS
eukprot:2229220-Amphidinium_carterae.1